MRRIKRLLWDETNVEHIATHGVTPDQVEEVCFSRPVLLKSRAGTRLALGQTVAGEYLFVVLRLEDSGSARCITARPMTTTEKRLYRKRRPTK